jgi:hypothetical protein
MTKREHYYNIEFEGLCLREADLKKILQKISVSTDAEIDMKTLSNPEIFEKYKSSESQLTDALEIYNILKQIDISKISYDGSGTFLGGE